MDELFWRLAIEQTGNDVRGTAEGVWDLSEALFEMRTIPLTLVGHGMDDLRIERSFDREQNNY